MVKMVLMLLISSMLKIFTPLHAEMALGSCEEHRLLEKILDNSVDCVAFYDGSHLIILSEKIVFIQETFFIDINGTFYPLPLLTPSKYGHYLTVGNEQGSEEIPPNPGMPLCPQCDVAIDDHGICRNPACLFFGLKVL